MLGLFIHGAPVAQDKLALAKQLASKINIKAVAGGKGQTQFTVATEAFLKGGEGAGQTMITAKSVVDYLAAKLNARLNYTPSDEPMLVEDGGIFQKFEEELETNDVPRGRQPMNPQEGETAAEDVHSLSVIRCDIKESQELEMFPVPLMPVVIMMSSSSVPVVE